MSSKNNGFTASDIERYYSGEMLPEERHALEKAALDDPFLADALEGYDFTSTAADDLAKIKSRLEKKLDRKKVVPIFQKYKWLSVAAIVLIIAGAGWFAYSISQKENNTSVTALEKKLPEKDSNSIVASPQKALHDSVGDKKTPVVQGTVSGNEPKAKENKINQVTVGLTANNQLNKQDEAIGKNNNAEIISKAISVPSQNEVASANNRFSNVQRNNANINNVISPDPRLNNVSNDDTRKKSYYKTESNADVVAKVRSANTNDTVKNLNIVLKPLPRDSSLKEVVVGYGMQQKSAERYPRVIIDTLEPAEGYLHFDDYVANNLKMPAEIKDKPVSGEVQLSFDVDKEGQPTNITVVKSLCQKCDEEAIRLLKEGPKWNKKKNKKGKITIRF